MGEPERASNTNAGKSNKTWNLLCIDKDQCNKDCNNDILRCFIIFCDNNITFHVDAKASVSEYVALIQMD